MKNVSSVPWTYTYNELGMLKEVKEDSTVRATYAYDGLGWRVKVEGYDSSTWTVSIFSGQDVLYETRQDGGWTKYLRENGMLLARVDCPAGGSCVGYYYLEDHLGSTRKVLKGLFEQVSVEYEPFGKPYAVSGSKAFKFTGEKHDDPTDLVYDPNLGRFVSADPILGAHAQRLMG